MNAAAGLLLETSYKLRHYEWAGIPLDRLLATILVILAGLMATRWLPGGTSGVAICGLLVVLLLLVQAWAKRRQFLLFRAEPPAARYAPSGLKLDPQDKLLLRASGQFEVEGKQQAFTELQAYLRSFETREHAVMALVPPSNALVIGRWPGHEIGMWYMFFQNNDLQRIERGTLCFGLRQRPALRLSISQEIAAPSSPLDVWGGYRSGKRRTKTLRKTIYLSFENPQDLQQVLANLAADATKLAPS